MVANTNPDDRAKKIRRLLETQLTTAERRQLEEELQRLTVPTTPPAVVSKATDEHAAELLRELEAMIRDVSARAAARESEQAKRGAAEHKALPVGVPAGDETTAVKVTCFPDTEGLTDESRVVVVGAK